MEDVREVRIIGPRCTSQEALHAFIAKKLGFPDYYGGNLAALADCLSEMGVPTRITIAINDYEVEPGIDRKSVV